jgi:hypothetical protein
MDPMNEPVRHATSSDKAWADLAAQLSPVASLARIDVVTSRAVGTVTVLGLLITGLGAVAAGQVAHCQTARGLAIAAVICATASVACALTAQLMTITRRLNPANLAEVKAWYRRQFEFRARVTQVATVFLILSALLVGATAVANLLFQPG